MVTFQFGLLQSVLTFVNFQIFLLFHEKTTLINTHCVYFAIHSLGHADMRVQKVVSHVIVYIILKKSFFCLQVIVKPHVELFFVCVFTKSIILLRLAKCEIIITNLVLCASLVTNISYLGAQIEELLNTL